MGWYNLFYKVFNYKKESDMKNKTNSNKDLEVTAIPSKPGQPESGRIIVKGPGVYKEIPAVIFTPKQVEEIYEIAKECDRKTIERKL